MKMKNGYLIGLVKKFESAVDDYFDAVHEKMAGRCTPVDVSFYRERAQQAAAHIHATSNKFQNSEDVSLREESRGASNITHKRLEKALAFERRSRKRAAV